jgi:excisionase family DNA binding protein
MDRIYSISDAAEYLGVFPLTLRNWEKKGLIKVFRTLGGHRRYKKSELDKILNIGTKEDMLIESIEILEGINLGNSHRGKLNKLIEDLRRIHREL